MVALLLACAAPGPTDTAPSVEEAPLPWILDAQGRALILHGMNVMGSSKSDPDRMPDIEREHVQRMARDWGFNFTRFLIFWDHVEPTPGQIDPAYLDLVEERLDWFAEAGIFVVLDMHQDVYAQRFCCDGAPDWAIRDDGEPFEQQEAWYLNYLQPAVQRSFDSFFLYDDGAHADLQDHYAQSWQAVAQRLGEHPAVLGYDLMNEPSAGSATDLVELLGTENPSGSHPAFDQERLQPFHQRMIEALREVDTQRWIFYETRYGAPGNGLPSYMGTLTDPREGPPRLAFFPHYYSLRFEALQAWDPAQDSSMVDWEAHRTAEAAAQGAPLLLGEWGFDPDWEGAEDALRAGLAMADRSTTGWAWWSLDPGGWSLVDADWQERGSADLLVRPYARRVAGTPTSHGYDPDTRVMTLAWTEREGVTGPTEIFVPQARHYPGGFTVDGGGEALETRWDPLRQVLLVTTPATGGAHRLTLAPAG